MKTLASIPVPSDILLRHRARRFMAIDNRITGLYEHAARLKAKREALSYFLRLKLSAAQKPSLPIPGNPPLEVVVRADSSPKMRRCRVVFGADGRGKLLEPGRSTKIVVRKLKLKAVA